MPRAAAARRPYVLALPLVIGAAFLLRWLASDYVHVSPGGDAQAYLTMAAHAAQGEPIRDNLGNAAMYNVGYPLLLAGVFTLTGASVAAAQLLNAALGALAAWLVFLVALELRAGERAALLAAAMWALYVESWTYAAYVAKENLMIPLLLGVVLLTVRTPLPSGAGAGRASILGGLYGALSLVGNAGLFALPITALATLSGAGLSMRTRVFRLALMLLVAFTVALPWLMRNHQVLGAPVLNTNGGFNFYLGNNPAATGYFIDVARTPLVEEWGRWREADGELLASRRAGEAAWAHIREHPGATAELAARKAVLFWLPPVHAGEGTAGPLERAARAVWLLEYVLLGCLALMSFGWLFRAPRALPFLWLFLAGYTAVHMAFYVSYRYRLVVMPLVCVLAAYALVKAPATRKAEKGAVPALGRPAPEGVAAP